MTAFLYIIRIVILSTGSRFEVIHDWVASAYVTLNSERFPGDLPYGDLS